MKLARIILQGILGAPGGEYSLCRRNESGPSPLILVTGAAASGKTSFLRAIGAIKEAVGPYAARPAAGDVLRRGAKAGMIEATWIMNEAEVLRANLSTNEQVTRWEIGPGRSMAPVAPKLRELFATFPSTAGLGKFEFFPANRRLTGQSTLPADVAEARQPMLRLGHDRDKYADLEQVLAEAAKAHMQRVASELEMRGIALQSAEPDPLSSYKEAMAFLTPNVRLGSVNLTTGRVELRRRTGEVVGLQDLSDSEQQSFLFAVTFRRLSLNHSVVLVDTPELYIHPREHVAFLEWMAGLGRESQLIVATSSEAILSSVSREQIIDLDARKAPR